MKARYGEASRGLVAVAVLTASVLAPSVSFPAAEADLVISGATVLDGTGARPRVADVVVRGERIVAVRPAAGAREAGEAAEAGDSERLATARRIDARRLYLVPGLFDMHVHFGLGVPLPRREDETEEVLRRQLHYGVTSILQLGATDGSANAIGSLRARRASGEIVSPYLYATGGHLTLQGTHPVYTIFPPRIREAADALAAATPLDRPVDLEPLGLGLSFVRTIEAARTGVRERAAAGMDAIKITVESGPRSFGDDHPQMSVEMITAIVDEAHSSGLPVLAHVTSLDELEAVLEGGADAAVHMVNDRPLPDKALAARMAAAGFAVVPTLSLFAEPADLGDPFLRETVTQAEIDALTAPGFADRFRSRWDSGAALDELLAAVGTLHAAGVPIVVGTDTGNPFVFAGYDVHREMALLVRAGLSPGEALAAATRGAAELIGVGDEVGTIEPGKRADLLLLEADPLVDIGNTRRIRAVIAAGRVHRAAALTSSRP